MRVAVLIPPVENGIVGGEIGVTRERVRQIQMDALRKMRKLLEREGFSEDILVNY